jgi:hypothetical protein
MMLFKFTLDVMLFAGLIAAAALLEGVRVGDIIQVTGHDGVVKEFPVVVPLASLSDSEIGRFSSSTNHLAKSSAQ